MAISSIQTTETILTKFVLNMYYGMGQHTGYVHTIILNITPYFGHSTPQNQFLFFTENSFRDYDTICVKSRSTYSSSTV